VSDVLLGVIIGLLSGHVAEWIKWKSQNRKDKKARELELKRELYLPLAAAFTEGMDLIARVSEAPANSLSALKLSQESQAALAAKDFVANDEVLFSTGAAANAFAQGMLRMMAIKVREAALSVDLEYLTLRIEQLNSDSAQINGQMELLNGQGKTDQKFFEIYGNRFERNHNELNDLFTEQSEKQGQKNALILQMHKQSIAELTLMSRHVAKAVIAIRKDMELPPNDDTILSLHRSSIEEVGKAMPGFIDEVWANLKIPNEGEAANRDSI